MPGGHCLPVYPHFISFLKEAELTRKVIEVNENVMPRFIVATIETKLKKEGKVVKGSKVLILGRSYRSGVKEDRHSAGIRIMKLLKRKGATVIMYDPLYTKDEMKKLNVMTFDSLEKCLKEADVVVIANDEKKFKKVKKLYKGPVVDIFGVLR